MNEPRIPRRIAALTGLLLFAGNTLADAIDEIVVSADLRGRTVADMPASITVLDAEAVEARAIQHFEELVASIPNLNWSGDGHRARYFQMRGVGELEQYQGAPNPSVGFLIDDIDFSGIGTVATLFDIGRVEVLRGPQGTRYGANALAGLVYMQSAMPTEEFDGRAEVSAGDDGMFAAGVALGGALGDSGNVAGRISLHHHESDGFRRNAFLDRDDTNGRDETTLRGRLRFSAGDAWEFNAAALFADVDNGYDAFAIDNSLTMLSDKPGKDAQQSLGASLRADFRGSDHVELTSITSVADSDIRYSFDADWGNDDAWSPVTYDYISVSDRARRTISQEVRLVAEDWLFGVYALRLDDETSTLNRGEYYDPFFDFADGLDDLFVSDYSATNVAAFGQVDRDLGAASRLTVGLRMERRTTDYADNSGLSAGPSETMWGGEVALHRDLGDRAAGFISLSKGYKAGGFNLGPAVPDAFREFDAEALWNLEAGIKGEFANGRLQLSASVFSSRHNDQQVRTSFQLDPGDPTSFGFVTINVERGDTLGAEAEMRWQPDDRWNLYASVGLLDTEFADVAAESLTSLEGRSQAHAPDYTVGAGAAYTHPRGFFARVDVSARDAFYFDVSHDEQSRSYSLVNARVGYGAGRWSATFWGRNLADRNYAVRGFYFGNEPPDFPNELYVRRGDPRQLGLTLDWSF